MTFALLTLICFPIIGSIIVFLNNWSWIRFSKNILNVMTGALIGAIIGLIVALVAILIVGQCINNKFESYIVKRPIYSFNLANSIHGDFKLGYGSVDGTEKYAFFVKNGDGSYEREYADISSKIYQSNTTPHVEWTISKESYPSWYMDWSRELVSKTTIVIPEGSIVEKFDVR